MISISSARDNKKDLTFLDIAFRLGTLSTCSRASVGAVIVREGRCISWGFNGAPPGLPHCSETNHGLEVPRGDKLEISLQPRGAGCQWATHAEANALAYAARQGISTDGGTLYVSISPCATCSRLLIAAGIVRVCYNDLYRDTTGLDLLHDAGVDVVRP